MRDTRRIEVDVVQLEPRQRLVPVLQHHDAVADHQGTGRQVVQDEARQGAGVPAPHDLGGEREAARTQPLDGDGGRIELDAQSEQLPVLQQLPDIGADPPAGGTGEDAVVVRRAQLQLIEVKLGAVPPERRPDVGESDVIAAAVEYPVFDLRLIPRRAVERELQRQHDQ
jgi:hypothetical protein